MSTVGEFATFTAVVGFETVTVPDVIVVAVLLTVGADESVNVPDDTFTKSPAELVTGANTADDTALPIA